MITDPEAPESITIAMASAAQALGARVIIVNMPAASVGGVEPPAAVAAAMRDSRAMIFQTTAGMVHTNAARDCVASGGRFLDMWGCTEDMLLRGGPTADYDQVAAVTTELYRAMEGGRSIRARTPAGTDIRLDMTQRPIFAFTGHARDAGSFSAMPEGEVAVCPLEGTAHGVLVKPAALERRDIAFPREPIKITIEAGEIAGIDGGREAGMLLEMLETAGASSRNIAEFAIGTNHWAKVGTTLRDAKKSYGTFHIGIGDNRSFGGVVESPLHMDLIFEEPDIYVDDKTIVKSGRILAAPETH